jgi:hypothetical protein
MPSADCESYYNTGKIPVSFQKNPALGNQCFTDQMGRKPRPGTNAWKAAHPGMGGRSRRHRRKSRKSRKGRKTRRH